MTTVRQKRKELKWIVWNASETCTKMASASHAFPLFGMLQSTGVYYISLLLFRPQPTRSLFSLFFFTCRFRLIESAWFIFLFFFFCLSSSSSSTSFQKNVDLQHLFGVFAIRNVPYTNKRRKKKHRRKIK